MPLRVWLVKMPSTTFQFPVAVRITRGSVKGRSGAHGIDVAVTSFARARARGDLFLVTKQLPH